MTTFALSAYGTNPLAGRDRNNAKARGWGNGWPNCQTDKMVKVTAAGAKVLVRREIAELVKTLFLISEKLGYDINPAGQENQTWGFSCRAIRNSNIASNHSWGLAIDVNSLANWYSRTFHSDIPPAVVHAWEMCLFYWGGRYSITRDTMHFEFIGTPAQVAECLAKAKAMLASLMKPGGGNSLPPKMNPDAITISTGAMQDAANGKALTKGEWQYNDVDAFLAWCVRLTESGGKFVASDETRAVWQRGIAQREYAAAGRQVRQVIKNLQERYALTPDGVFGPKTAALMSHDGFIIKP